MHLFQLISRPDGTRDLLTARSPTAMIVVHVINSKTLDPSPTAFYSIPREYDEVRSFRANDRHHLFHEDMDGDGKREIVVGTAGGMIVALDCRCQKLWARRLASPPTVIKALPARGPRRTQILVGCEDGSVLALALPSAGDGRFPTEWAGTPVQSARLTGSPTDVVALEADASIIAILATDRGQVAGYRF